MSSVDLSRGDLVLQAPTESHGAVSRTTQRLNWNIYESTIHPSPRQEQPASEECCCMRSICRWIVLIVTFGCYDIQFVQPTRGPIELVPIVDRAALNIMTVLRLRGIENLQNSLIFIRKGDAEASTRLAEQLREDPRMQIPDELDVNTLADTLVILLQQRPESRVCGRSINAFASADTECQNKSDSEITEILRPTVRAMDDWDRGLFMAFAFLVGDLTSNLEGRTIQNGENTESLLDHLSLDRLMSMEGIGSAFVIPIDEMVEVTQDVYQFPNESETRGLAKANQACKGIQHAIEHRDAIFINPEEAPASES